MSKKFGLDQVAVRLVKEAPLLSDEEISSPEDAVRILGDAFQDYDREVVGVVNLRSDNVPINMTIISMGTLNQSLVHPREVLKAAFLSNAASILLFHNHPSGSLEPSKDDIAITGRMQQLCMLAGVPVVDHIILGGNQSYYSFREKKILPMEQIHYSVDLNDVDLKVAEKEAENYGYKKTEKKSIKKSLEENRKKIASSQKSSGVKRKQETLIE
ncbi:JAB domain-containing protein [Blautia sp. HCP28S3_G10]|uniref:JAB domain-containing protein n=1 Tax=Blautia sp. HCP28S3_G10 TaxID=3438908 RepID=UPI003F899E8E